MLLDRVANKVRQIWRDHQAMSLVRQGRGDVYLVHAVGGQMGDIFCCYIYQRDELHEDLDPSAAIIKAMKQFTAQPDDAAQRVRPIVLAYDRNAHPDLPPVDQEVPYPTRLSEPLFALVRAVQQYRGHIDAIETWYDVCGAQEYDHRWVVNQAWEFYNSLLVERVGLRHTREDFNKVMSLDTEDVLDPDNQGREITSWEWR